MDTRTPPQLLTDYEASSRAHESRSAEIQRGTAEANANLDRALQRAYRVSVLLVILMFALGASIGHSVGVIRTAEHVRAGNSK